MVFEQIVQFRKLILNALLYTLLSYGINLIVTVPLRFARLCFVCAKGRKMIFQGNFVPKRLEYMSRVQKVCP